MFYQSDVVECSAGVEELAKAIEKKAEKMLNKGYNLVTVSMVGTDKAILVFKIEGLIAFSGQGGDPGWVAALSCWRGDWVGVSRRAQPGEIG